LSDERASLLAALDGVEGWLGTAEAWALRQAVATVPGSGAVRVVEIGSWKGRSTIALASGAAARPGGGVVHAIDPHRGGVAHRITGEPDSWDGFLANLERAGLRDAVEPVRATSRAARPSVADDSVQVLFVDGSHRYEDVLHDLDAWRPALCVGARVAVHDAVGYPGVGAALRERVLTRRSAFRSPRLVEETLLVEYRPDSPWRRTDSRRVMAMRGRIAARRAARLAKRAARRMAGRAK
jgi:predicted O-methyltransferase YrrM